ncbi:phosphate/phosphite/phosphonate ABC transporter substrate-binding protein [Acidimangrovimonas sediminis]|uniref:phosphate/phosphite/phosphonate ABC transporter substrate-binding protein n=1 Tax=Acidimangrovimonas sediminis TaxID=2056283 RepID=UPI000C7FCECA|nr:phosphate/phosphite/phosphonate ABC transporter substrate-binding protein [Acidimangrovimonas sediminis]
MTRHDRYQFTRRGFLGTAIAAGSVAAAGPLMAADTPLRIGMVPDAGATQVSVEAKAPLQAYLEKALGRPVKLIVPTNYNATVEGLGNGSLDVAYLGGLTYVKAHKRYGAVPLVQRKTDREFHSLFITRAGSGITKLADLKGKSFAFGDVNSTSGHLMPFHAMKAAGIDPETDIKARFTGSHPATIKAVEAGVVAAGACDETVFHQMVKDGKVDPAKVTVFYTTEPFVDYVWVARKGLDDATRTAIVKAFTALTPETDSKVLDILRGTEFVKADDKEYDLLRDTAKQAKLF